MTRYLLLRLWNTVPVLIVVALVSFLLMQAVPGDASAILLGLDATEAEIEEAQRLMGVDRPTLVQLWDWSSSVLGGDLGRSFLSREPVLAMYLHRLPVTVALTVYALVLTVLIGIPAGVVAALRKNTFVDQWVMTVSVLGVSLPNFWLALILILVFGVGLGWFPTGGYVPFTEDPIASLHSLTLPAVTLALMNIGLVARISRSSMLEVLGQDYVRTARAKGLPRRAVVYRHALKNAMIPVTTVIGIALGALLSGTVVIETVFSIPGVGRLLVSALQARDYPVIQGGLLLSALIFVFVNLLIDILYTVFDPRIRYDTQSH